jgi:hypothetical protein
MELDRAPKATAPAPPKLGSLGSPIFSPRAGVTTSSAAAGQLQPAAEGSSMKRAVEQRDGANADGVAQQKKPRTAALMGSDGRLHAAAESPEFALDLSAEQKVVARRAMRGENLFITGPAGTGKSFLLRHIIRELQTYYNPDVSTHQGKSGATGGGGLGDAPPANMQRLIAAKAWPEGVPVFYSQFERDEHSRKQGHRCMVAYGTPGGSLCYLSFENSDVFLALYLALLRCVAPGAVAPCDVCFHEQLYLPCRQYFCCKATAAPQIEELEQAIRAAAAPSDLGPATVLVAASGDAQVVFAEADPVPAPSAATPAYAAALSTYAPVVTAKAVHEAQPHLTELLSAKYSARQTLRLVGSCVPEKPESMLLPLAAEDASSTGFASWLQTIHSAADLSPYVTTADDGDSRARPTWSNPPLSSKVKTVSDLTGRKVAKQRGTVAVTAPTGIAAVNVGGVTIHSFAGIGLGNGDTQAIIERVKRNKKACENWTKAAALVIDEVSMLSAQLFELLDAVARAIRCNSLPFGGLQLILCGDFCQLPPVVSSTDSGGSGFCFQSQAWAIAGLETGTVVLQDAHRQASDPTFARLLNLVRTGGCPEETMTALRGCVVGVKSQPTDGILATRLYCTNRDVDAENNARLAGLKGGACVFNAEDSFDDSISEWQREKLSEVMDKKVAGRLMLKMGAQVVLVRNLSRTLANGSRGVVVGMQAMLRVRVRFDNGEEQAIEPATFSQSVGGAGAMSRKQLPLKLGWALTVHRAQGMTLTRAEVDLDGAFECGQSYVALSRVTSLAGLWLRTELRPEQVTVNREVLAYYSARAASRPSTTAPSAGSVGATVPGANAAGPGGAGVEHVVTVEDKGPLGIILTQKAGHVLVASVTTGGRAASSEGGAGLRRGMVLLKAGDAQVKPPAMLWQSRLARLPRPLVLTFGEAES